jgi:hypothetical protein
MVLDSISPWLYILSIGQQTNKHFRLQRRPRSVTTSHLHRTLREDDQNIRNVSPTYPATLNTKHAKRGIMCMANDRKTTINALTDKIKSNHTSKATLLVRLICENVQVSLLLNLNLTLVASFTNSLSLSVCVCVCVRVSYIL